MSSSWQVTVLVLWQTWCWISRVKEGLHSIDWTKSMAIHCQNGRQGREKVDNHIYFVITIAYQYIIPKCNVQWPLFIDRYYIKFKGWVCLHSAHQSSLWMHKYIRVKKLCSRLFVAILMCLYKGLFHCLLHLRCRELCSTWIAVSAPTTSLRFCNKVQF